MMKEIEGTDKWKDIACSWIGRILLKNVHPTQSNLQIQCNSIKIPMEFSQEEDEKS